jgi:hypothetical protein
MESFCTSLHGPEPLPSILIMSFLLATVLIPTSSLLDTAQAPLLGREQGRRRFLPLPRRPLAFPRRLLDAEEAEGGAGSPRRLLASFTQKLYIYCYVRAKDWEKCKHKPVNAFLSDFSCSKQNGEKYKFEISGINMLCNQDSYQGKSIDRLKTPLNQGAERRN